MAITVENIGRLARDGSDSEDIFRFRLGH